MNERIITRSYLETLPFAELVGLADEYGVDVPEDLDRRFLIAELLELAQEESGQNEEMIISSENSNGGTVLHGNYNETQISCVFRNPAWLFVFWNINENDLPNINDSAGSLKLRICYLKDAKELIPEEAFEIQASTESQEQYVLISAEKAFVKVELIHTNATGGKVLAFSPVMAIPRGAEMVNEVQPGSYEDIPQILKLSGLETSLAEQYRKHRHSFS